MDKWALFVDVEGFSKIYPSNMVRALMPLRALMEAIYRIGTRVCSESPYLLFAHQIGDGFIIVSECAKRSPELPVAIGIFLLRHALLAGGIGKCAISQGEFADIRGCYPDVIRDNCDDSGRVRLGHGLMRVFPVMGSALINSYRLSNSEKGSLLIVDSDLAAALPTGAVVTTTTPNHHIVDWIHSAMPEIAELESKTGIPHPSAGDLEQRTRVYVDLYRATLPQEWVDNTLRFNGL